MDDEGYLGLRKEHESDYDSLWKVIEWMQDACEHRGMVYQDMDISWPGYRWFQGALEALGWERFPVLKRELPESNGGCMSPTVAQQVLEELKYLEGTDVLGEKTVLLDSKTRAIVSEGAREHVCWVISYPEGGAAFVGIDERGLFVQDPETHEIIFHAKRFRQSCQEDGLKLTDVDTPQSILLHLPSIEPFKVPEWRRATGIEESDYPRELHVERQRWHTSEVQSAITCFKEVFEAAVETGNPVRWE